MRSQRRYRRARRTLRTVRMLQTLAGVVVIAGGLSVARLHGLPHWHLSSPAAGTSTSSTSTSSTLTSSVRASGTASSAGAVSRARAELARLVTVAKRPYVAGYQRSCAAGDGCSFGPAWTDDNDDVDGHNGCDTRNDVLAAQLTEVTYRAGSHCVVIAGALADPYTGHHVIFRKANADAIEIDHVVPLALAWDLGAAHWSRQRRIDYANDVSLVLLAVDGPSNQAKSDSGPGEWMPANKADWCAYDERFISILSTYRLEVTAADKAAMSAVLARC